MKNSNTNSVSKSKTNSNETIGGGALRLARIMNRYAEDESKVRYGCRLFISGKKYMSLDMKAVYKCAVDGDNATVEDVFNAGWLIYRMAGMIEYPECLTAYSVWFDYDSPETFAKDFTELFAVVCRVVERVVDETADREKIIASLKK